MFFGVALENNMGGTETGIFLMRQFCSEFFEVKREELFFCRAEAWNLDFLAWERPKAERRPNEGQKNPNFRPKAYK